MPGQQPLQIDELVGRDVVGVRVDDLLPRAATRMSCTHAQNSRMSGRSRVLEVLDVLHRRLRRERGGGDRADPRVGDKADIEVERARWPAAALAHGAVMGPSAV
jgi:hypothetical protein